MENQNPQQPTVSTSAVLAMLRAGKTRSEIREELGLTAGQAKALFSTPSLKNKKTIVAARGINIIDDLAEEAPTARPSTAAIPASAAATTATSNASTAEPFPGAAEDLAAEETEEEKTSEEPAQSSTTSAADPAWGIDAEETAVEETEAETFEEEGRPPFESL